MQGSVLVRRDNDGSIDVLSHNARRRQNDIVRLVCLTVRFLEFGLCQLVIFVISNRNPRSAQAILAGTRDLNFQRDVSACIHFVG